ncbi:hypothetical protein A1QO_07900 [Vibrio genomosp. F10 str. ZF-129]|uniref:Uncharacterized protein n=1 Tax=Vibrio genomosp. F10 str. ZF-129 TaxID=1187848 RepID=A0A1E5BF63_9VIBR|nr:helicase RepA family protein [Vibrio genomosp. F10]OEE34432.1 hypothetical protein A1QO_07900 [Vibrio genomosp. F10 str. ZF-129]
MSLKKLVIATVNNLVAPNQTAAEPPYNVYSSLSQASFNYGHSEGIPSKMLTKPESHATLSPREERIFKPKTLKFLRGSEGYERTLYWCVKNYIPTNSMGVIYAPSASLKSFLAIDIACSVAEGFDWCGNKVKKGAVLYVAAEGALGASRRIRGWEIHNNATVNNLFVLDHAIFLTYPADMTSLKNAIKALEESNRIKFDLIILDTLARNFIGDENTQQDMSKFITACDSLKAEIECSILLIHHTGKDASKGARGSSALRAACDCEFQVQRIDGGKSLNFISTKQKDIEECEPIQIDFETVQLDVFDDEHNEIETLVKVAHSMQKKTAGNNLETKILEYIDAQPNKKITRKMLREFIYPNQKKLEDKERKQLQRALKSLQESKLIFVFQLDNRSQGSDEIQLTT